MLAPERDVASILDTIGKLTLDITTTAEEVLEAKVEIIDLVDEQEQVGVLKPNQNAFQNQVRAHVQQHILYGYATEYKKSVHARCFLN